MNQDSDQNEPRRDGERRSFGRRDDDRTGGSERPRFNRDRDDRPRFGSTAGPPNRSNDRPRFNRDAGPRDAGSPDRGSPDRGSRDRNDNSRPFGNGNRTPSGPNRTPGGSRPDDRPRFDRRDDNFRDRRDPNFGDKRRNTESRDNDRPGFTRDRNFTQSGREGGTTPADRPERQSRDFDQRRPRFDDNRTSDRFNRTSDSNERRSNDRNDNPPRFGRNSGPRDRREGDAPFRGRDERPRRDAGPRDNDRPRFDRDDRSAGAGSRPAFNRDRDTDRTNDRPRFNRDAGSPDRGPRDRNDDRPRSFSRDSRDDRNGGEPRPRFSRDAGSPDRGPRDAGRSGRGPRDGGSDTPRFKRVGGFSREADERNRSNSGRDADNRPSNAREDDRFSPEQRKDSGDRRTGRYDKAPNYNLHQERGFGSRRDPQGSSRDKRPGGPGSQDDKPKRTPANDEPGQTRLNRYIANSGVCSRREADELIARGDISVNGKVVTEMGHKVKPGDTVKYGTKVLNPERFAYVLLNKPKDYITTTEDPEERRTVMELVADAGNFRLYPVGRLDRNTTGLLLLTNDGELADKLTHPSNNVRKIYQVELDKPITDEHFEAIQQGIELEDGLIKPDALSIVTPDAQVIGIEIHSGRNRIVRRMFEHFGYEVIKLDRTTFAGLTKKDLPRGKWRFLDPKEVVKLKYFN